MHKNIKIKGIPIRPDSKLVKILTHKRIEKSKIGKLIKSI